ncbi:MAG TPA: 3-hydroxyacyl-ACP dehydratase FabZ family protein [Terriglobia bacterium]|nr:3-hydroxyacyl-ACP dehydratase FabZ family protein [Terriglobia bacterium]
MSEPNQETTALLHSAVERILPHRYPFLLVDRVTELVPGVRIAGVKHFSGGDQGAQGHFPNLPIVPTAIMLELVTQLGAVLVLERPEMRDKIAMILQIPSAEMIEPVHPGETVQVQAEVVKLRESWGELTGTIHRDGTLVARGQVRFAIANARDVLPSGPAAA